MIPVEQNKNLLESLMKDRPEQFADILKNKDKYEVQVIYTQIDRNADNVPSFKSFYFNTDSNRYFYPASTVKMPTAFFALEKLNELNIEGLNKSTAMLTDSAFSGQVAVVKDSTASTGLPSIGHYIKKIFLVSDNDAFNRVYEFVGQEELNKKLQDRGYTNARILHRLSVFLSEEENRHTNPVRFLKGDAVIYQQPQRYNQNKLPSQGRVLMGEGYMRNGQLINEPMDFTGKNFMPLGEMQRMLRAVLFPEYTADKYTFNLTDTDYRFIYQYMSQLPTETTYPHYDKDEYEEAYSKLLLCGNDKAPIPDNIRIFNKFGQSYGYLTDNAYIIDTKNKVEFMLSAVIHTNENRIFNDNNYQYDQIAFPFMKDLGQLIYQYELKRSRLFQPNLSRFMISYDTIVKTSDQLHQNLYQNYDHYHIPALNSRRIKRTDIAPFIEKLKALPRFEVTKLGESVQGREINLIKLGNGPKKVLLWSQMHGDESTATRALFEIFRFFASDDALNEFKEAILNETTLYIIPMLNPDGAEVFERHNALHIDINRDALRLISPEAQILKKIRDKYEPEFGFNLHDQSKYYNTSRTDKTASISFLAPAFNYEKDINKGRGNAMKLIVSMNAILQQYIPGRVGRYNDDFEPRAFGDNIQKWGTNTILIESGGYPEDPEKSQLVKMNFIAILHALDQIAGEKYTKARLEDYEKIPENDRKFFDLLVRNGQVLIDGKPYLMDIGVFTPEKEAEGSREFYHTSVIDDLGDLSTFYGYEELDAKGMDIVPGKVYPETFQNINLLTTGQIHEFLKRGYVTIKMEQMPQEQKTGLPINIVPADSGDETHTQLNLGDKANFIISRNKVAQYAVVNGRVINLTGQ